MPPKGSKQSNKKNEFLEKFKKNKKEISKMELLIFDQENQLKCQETQLTEIEDEANLKKKELIKKKDKVESLNKKIMLLSQEINNKKKR